MYLTKFEFRIFSNFEAPLGCMAKPRGCLRLFDPRGPDNVVSCWVVTGVSSCESIVADLGWEPLASAFVIGVGHICHQAKADLHAKNRRDVTWCGDVASRSRRYGCNASQWAALAGSVEMCAHEGCRICLPVLVGELRIIKWSSRFETDKL